MDKHALDDRQTESPGPQQGVATLDLTDQQRHGLLIDQSSTRIDHPSARCFHQLFEEQVERTPDAVAVVFQEQQLTYRELNRWANALAHRLSALGAGPDVLVGICVEPSLEMLPGLLGILKAGSAYVPLDPVFPRDRLAFMLEDSKVSIVLTQSWLQSRLSLQRATQVICLDSSRGDDGEESDTSPDSGVRATDLAYVIYTSGSTGTPKGVMIVQRGLVNYLVWCAERYQVAAGTGALVHSSIAIDLTITGLFSPLVVGRAVYLAPQGSGIEPLVQAWRHVRNLSLIKTTPAHLQLLRYQIAPHEAAGRTRAFIIGGEQLLAESVEFWRRYAPETMLINEYGPTETVVGCCIYQVPSCGDEVGAVPIGRPIANTQLYILGERGQPVPSGVTGELYIAGDGVARGYLNRPALTRDRFLPHPFTEEPNRFLYRTGDLARYRSDGNIEFLGRCDDQVKIRGHRVELGEIEARLREHPAVAQCAVLLRGNQADGQRLVGYWVANPDSAATPRELREYLCDRLPNFMVPSAFVRLEDLPRTPSGKLDRKALPAPTGSRGDWDGEYRAPRNALEDQLAALWADLLGMECIGISDNFFEFGGDSLLAARLMVRIEEGVGHALPVAALVCAPTIDQLAAIMRNEPRFTAASSLIPVQSMGTNPPFFCVPGGQSDESTLLRPGAMFAKLARRLGSEQPFYSFWFNYPTQDKSEPLTIQRIAAGFLRDVRSLQPKGPYFLGGWSFGGLVAYEMAQQLRAQGQAVELLALIDSVGPGYPRKRPWFEQFRLQCNRIRSLGLRQRLVYLGRALGAWAHTQWTTFRRVMGKLLGKVNPWDRVMQIENSYLSSLAICPGPLVLFVASETLAQTADQITFSCDPYLGWCSLVKGEIRTHRIQGTHHTMFEEPGLSELADQLATYLRSRR